MNYPQLSRQSVLSVVIALTLTLLPSGSIVSSAQSQPQRSPMRDNVVGMRGQQRAIVSSTKTPTVTAHPTTESSLVITPTADINALTNALLAPSSGITILSSNLVNGLPTQQGVYTGFNLAPSSGSTPTLTLPDGVALSSGNANIGNSNTTNSTSINTGNGDYPALTTLVQTISPGAPTLNANVLEYTFTVGPGNNAIALDFIFGTEEFPTQSVTDIFGVFVDGVNYARFADGSLVANQPGNPTNFILNPVGGNLYAIEYNGLTRRLSLVGLLDPSLTTHTLVIGVADTFDTFFDSGVFVANLRATTAQDGGISDPNVNDQVEVFIHPVANAVLLGVPGYSTRQIWSVFVRNIGPNTLSNLSLRLRGLGYQDFTNPNAVILATPNPHRLASADNFVFPATGGLAGSTQSTLNGVPPIGGNLPIPTIGPSESASIFLRIHVPSGFQPAPTRILLDVLATVTPGGPSAENFPGQQVVGKLAADVWRGMQTNNLVHSGGESPMITRKPQTKGHSCTTR